MLMGPYVDSIEPDPLLPASTGIVVIGGGIIGTSAALHLATAGVGVVLCEKAYLACEQSSRNWGWCRQTGRDPREMPLIVESLRLWRELDRRAGGSTGFRQCGVMYVAESEADEARYAQWIEMARPFDVGARLVRGADLAELMPGASRAYRAALHVPTDGCAEPQRAVPAIARAAQAAGARVLAPCAVRGLDLFAGRVRGVFTERGRIGCEAVLLAGGAWTSLFCASLGVRLPQLKVLASVMRTAPAQGPDTCTLLADLAYRRRQDGGYTIARGTGHVVPLVPDSLRYFREFWPTLRRESTLKPRLNALSSAELTMSRRWPLDATSPFEKLRVLDPAPDAQLNAEAWQAMVRLYPPFRDIAIVQQWGGYIDVTPDVVPYIGPVAQVPGLTVAAGFSGHGFGIGPAAGRLAAELTTGQPPIVDPTAFRLGRFSDGSTLVLGTDI
jgi:glycine/D-amino acid oxidase-like deaminating enzyme